MKEFDIQEIEERVRKVFRGRYRLIGRIGGGGMGQVYCVESTDRYPIRHALKIMARKSYRSEDSLFAEIRMLRQLNHPGIPRIIEAPEDQEYVYILQELVDGVSLTELLAPNKKLDLDTAILWMGDIADALAYLHDNHVIHRDIKPPNIMVTREGVIKVVDFGLAKISREDESAELKLMGTKEYTPPERYRGAPANEQTDIYQYGTTCYRILTGELPKVMRENPRRHMREMHKVLDRVPSPGLRAIVKKCIDIDPRKRYRNFHEIRYQLQTLDIFEREVLRMEQRRKVKKTWTIASLVLGACLFCTGAYFTVSIHNNHYDKMIRDADQKYEEMDLSEAADRYAEAKEYDPALPEAYVGEYKARLDAVDHRDKPDDYIALAGEIEQDMHDHPRLEDSASVWAEKGEAWYYAAEASKDGSKKQKTYARKALEAYDQALEQHPEEAEEKDLYLAKGHAYTLVEEYKNAEEMGRKIGSLSMEAQYLKAYSLEHQGEPAKAAGTYEAVIAKTENSTLKRKAITQAAALYMSGGDYERAIKVLKTGDADAAIARDFKRNQMLLDAYYKTWNWKKVIKQAGIINKMDKKNQKAYEYMARAQNELGRYEDAHQTIAAYGQYYREPAARLDVLVYGTELTERDASYATDTELCERFFRAYEQAEALGCELSEDEYIAYNELQEQKRAQVQ